MALINTIDKAMLGSDVVDSIYQGSNFIWGKPIVKIPSIESSTYQKSGQGFGTGNQTREIDIAYPSDGMKAGNVLVMVTYSRGNNPTNQFDTDPSDSGWIRVAELGGSNIGSYFYLYSSVWYKISDGTESGTVKINTKSDSYFIQGYMFNIIDAASSTPITVIGDSVGSMTTVITVPSITTVEDKSLIMATYGISLNSTPTVTSSGWKLEYSKTEFNGYGIVSQIYTREMETIGNTGDLDIAIAGNMYSQGVMFAINPKT